MKSQDLTFVRVARRTRAHDVLSAIADRYDGGALNACRRDGFAEDAEAPTRSRDAQRIALHQVYEFPIPSEARLRALFQLTAAEAKLAQRLACGDTVEEVARKLSIKMTTARTQLAAIFAKTDTRRQAKLVAILSRIAHLE